MVDKNKKSEEEAKIPVFTVLKKGTILKNIILNNPPPSSVSESSIESEEKSGKENEELLVGRHPDCHIMLDHPSISRFHLRIHPQPSSQKLSVTDLSSVHGTWVSGKRIESQVPIELAEGDMLKLGASTRVYRLQWVPLSRAFEIEKALIYMEASPEEEREETDQEENSQSFVKKLDDLWVTQIPSAPPMLYSMNVEADPPSEEQNQSPETASFATQRSLERENQSSSRKILEQGDTSSILSEPLPAESVNSSLPMEVHSAAHDVTQLEGETHGSEPPFALEILLDGENKSLAERRSEQHGTSNLWSRRGKSVGFLRVQTGRSREKIGAASAEIGLKSKNQEGENMTEDTLCKALFSGSDGEEKGEAFASDKENWTPMVQPLGLKLKKQELQRSSTSTKIVNLDGEDDTFVSDKENLTPTVSKVSKSTKPVSKSRATFERQMIKRRADRIPFQSIPANSVSKANSVSVLPNVASEISNSINNSQTLKKNNNHSEDQSVDQTNNKWGESKRKWNIVVDTSCLLKEESRRSLKRLEGLKGTHLIIPRMVIRELDCLKRRGSRFGKTTEAASVLQWIEECMVKTRWWIHVQSSAESMPIAPTPPASPRSRLSEGSSTEICSGVSNFVPFSTCGSLMEIVSPTAEDHILECALLFKRIRNDGQLVLLTNDIALKIKAMAEGLTCETPIEFWESLVNPYSERFMWVESSPRGPTWSSLDELVGLKENYHHCCPMRKTSKASEGAKGLKLILLHNSQYGQMNSVK